MNLAEVTCPTCFEVFEVAVPQSDEMPAEVDYDCEVCCRPMVIVFTGDGTRMLSCYHVGKGWRICVIRRSYQPARATSFHG